MPFTGRKYGLEINWYKDERRDPIKAHHFRRQVPQEVVQGLWQLGVGGRGLQRGRGEKFPAPFAATERKIFGVSPVGATSGERPKTMSPKSWP